MVIFHSYVSLPEGIQVPPSLSTRRLVPRKPGRSLPTQEGDAGLAAATAAGPWVCVLRSVVGKSVASPSQKINDDRADDTIWLLDIPLEISFNR